MAGVTQQPDPAVASAERVQLPLGTQLFRFVLAGTVSALVDYGLLVLGMALGLGHAPAKAISWVFGTITVYAINSRWTFDGGGSKRKHATEPGHVSTAMPGNIVDVLVKVGDVVKAGQAVLITEAMKMETEVQAAIAGKVTAVHVAKGDRVNPGEILIEIEG